MARRLEMTKVGIVDAERKARLAEMVVHTCTLAFESGGEKDGPPARFRLDLNLQL